MRRKDREMNRDFAVGIIDKSDYGLVSMIDQDAPYGIPLSIVRDGNTLYFHSSKEGRKVKVLEKNPEVSIAFVGNRKIPENYTNAELDEIVKDESKVSLLISSVFTTEFESAVVRGHVKLVEDKDEKIRAMKFICQKYTPSKMDYFDMAIRAGLSRTNVYSLEIENITSKRKKYDLQGKEMKWARMD